MEPIGRRRLSFGVLSPDEFELLCFYVVAIEYTDAVHVRNPDGGADTALPREDCSWARCWQSKRFTQQIKWPQCVASLDAAVANYEMPHYTFCFARDLTLGQERLFKKHLVGRHPGVVVDHWGASKLEGLLFSSDQGKRIAAEFYGDPESDARALARAIRAGGELSTGERVLDRLAAIAEHLRERDPYFTYLTVAGEVDAPRPGLLPETVLAVERAEAGSLIRIEAVPRPSTQPEQLPGVTTRMNEEQVEQFERFLGRGGDLELSGVQVEFQNLPRAFEGLDPSGKEMNVRLSKPRTLPGAWDARFSLETEGLDVDPIIVHLEPTLDVPDDWDAALIGEAGAFTVRMLFRWRKGRGQFTVQWGFHDDYRMSARERAAQLNFVAGLHQPGKLAIEDMSGERPRLELETRQRVFDEEFEALQSFVSDLAVIEEWTGEQHTPTELVPAEQVRAVHGMAQIIRAGESGMDFSRVVLRMPRQKASEVFSEANQFLLEVGVALPLFGKEIPIGKLRGLVDITASYVDTDDKDEVEVILEPASEAAARPTFELVR